MGNAARLLLALACLPVLARAPNAQAAAARTAGNGGPHNELADTASGEPEVRWTFGPLAFEREPIVLGERVLATGREPTGRRALVVLDLASGRVLGRTLFASSVPLALAAAGERVAVRTAPGRVDLHRLRGARLLAERAFTHAESVSAPVLDGEHLLLREGGELACYALDRREPLWRAQVSGAFHGTPALDGDAAFAPWCAPDGTAHLAELELATGRVRADAPLGRAASGQVPAADDGTLVVHAGAVFVRLGLPLPSTSGAELAWARVAREADDARALGAVTLHPLLSDPLELGGGWVAPELARDGSTRWVLVRDEGERQRAIELAASDHHAWLCAARAPASRAGDVLFLGRAAADARSLAVLWRRDGVPAFRPVPTGDDVLVVEGDRLLLLGGRSAPVDAARDRARGERERAERASGERLASLAAQALRGGDAAHAAELAAEAEALGTSGRALDLVRGELERSAGVPRPVGDPRRRTALEREAAVARASLPDALAVAADRASDAASKRALLAELFRIAPEHPHGKSELAELLPPMSAARMAAGGDAVAWLEFATHAAVRRIDLAGDLAGGEHDPDRAALARESWRPDALGYRSERLLVVTAATRSGSVARTLRTGELLCDVLAEVFGGERPRAPRLELVLYPTQDEYLAHSGSDLGGLESVLGFTAGHFDLGARVSRLWLPPDDHDGTRLSGVAAHELTHHWLSVRSSFGPSRSSAASPGFWIVEAAATWAEELRLDPAHGSWSTTPWRSASLDTVAAASTTELLDWSHLLTSSFDDYCRFETRPTCTLALAWQLGSAAPRSPMQLFYAQGAALAHWLYEADGGRNRGLLLRAVEGYYRGEPLDVARELGLTAEELGERVKAFAGEVIG